MPVRFTTFKTRGYYLVEYIGEMTDQELLEAYSDFFKKNELDPNLNVFLDLSRCNLEKVSEDGLEKISTIIFDKRKQHKIYPKSAIFAESDLNYGIARIFQVHSEKAKNIRVFRNKQEAFDWMIEK